MIPLGVAQFQWMKKNHWNKDGKLKPQYKKRREPGKRVRRIAKI